MGKADLGKEMIGKITEQYADCFCEDCKQKIVEKLSSLPRWKIPFASGIVKKVICKQCELNIAKRMLEINRFRK